MSEYTFLWNGTSIGDATYAPYQQLEFNKWFFAPRRGFGDTSAFVVANYLNSLMINLPNESSANFIISIDTGAVIIDKFLYINDSEKSFIIRGNQNNNSYRYDSIVLRLDYKNQTARLVLVEGNEKSSFPPTPPKLIKLENDLWEEELVRIFIDNVNPNISWDHIYDNRFFIDVGFTQANIQQNNLITNSEFLAFSGEQTTAVDAPDYWDIYGTPTSITSVSISSLDFMSRGRYIQIVNGGIKQTNIVAKGDVFSIKGLLHVVSGNAKIILNAYNKKQAYPVAKREIALYNTGVTTELKLTTSFKNLDVEYLEVIITGTGTFRVGQIILVEGFFSGPFRPFHEILLFRNNVIDTNWDGDAKSSGTYPIYFSSAFGGVIKEGTRGLILLVRCRDSNSSSTSSCSLSIRKGGINFGTLQIGRMPNNYWSSRTVVVPLYLINSSNYSNFIDVVISATGTNTFNVFIEIVGIIV